MLTWIILITSIKMAWSSQRPLYGIESTITNGRLSELCTERTERIMDRLSKKVLSSENPERTLSVYDDAFPKQLKIFNDFASAFLAGSGPPRIRAHKRRYPAYRRVFSDGFWMQVQMDHQVIELQAEPRSLPNYLKITPLIDRHFFAVGRTQGLKPDREWGMGHISEDLITGCPVEAPEILRNRVVREFNDVYFWTLVGNNIEADVHWDVHAERMKLFASWLTHFDYWLKLRATNTTKSSHVLAIAALHVVESHSIFRDFPEARCTNLTAMMFLAAQLREEDAPEFLKVSGYALRELFVTAMVYTQDSQSGSAFGIKFSPNPDETASKRIEFRRIPSQRDANEAAMWMNLLEGRWRLAHATTGLVPLVQPSPPANDLERIQLFERFILEAGANPLDFATFLPARLKWRIFLKSYPTPRWAEVRRRILCENELAG